jgi:pyruvate decarboxylase
MLCQARPVYLELPTDRVYNKIPRGNLDTPLKPTLRTIDIHAEEFVLDAIQKLVEKAGQDVVVLVDACTIRHDVMEEVYDLTQRTGYPVYSAPMGKTAVPEDSERYGGVCCHFLLQLRLGANVTLTDIRRLHFTSGN